MSHRELRQRRAGVVVAAGQTANVTLQSRAATTIRGRVVDWASGAGVPGMRCIAGLRSPQSVPMWIGSIASFSDDNGFFVLEGAPTGDVAVGCFPSSGYSSDGRAELTLAAGQDAACEVAVVKNNPDAPRVQFGGMLEPGLMPARFNVVAPNGPADRAGVRAGDVVTTIDGANVEKLTPWGVMVLLGQRAPSTTVHLGLSRGSQTKAADLVLPGH